MIKTNPLRILFFGSDIFSIFSLRGLYNIYISNSNLIESLQIVSRPAKWGGKRKSVLKCPQILEEYKTLKSLTPPIMCDNSEELTNKLLPLIQKEKFNILICVSFGLLIPQSLIEAVPYTLNVHPSLLPRYRGSSPIQYALLNNDKFTGVTIQSLHPTNFDKGEIISQSAELNIQQLLESSQNINTPPIFTTRLTHQLGQVGSKMLCDLIQNGKYLKNQNNRNTETKYVSSLAPRIQTSDKLIQWGQYDASQLYRRLMTLGPLYTFIKCGNDRLTGKDIMERVILHSFSIKQQKETEISKLSQIPGSFSIVEDNHVHSNQNSKKTKMEINCANGTSIDVKEIQIAGSVVGPPSQFLTNWSKRYSKNNNSKFHSSVTPIQFEYKFISDP